MQFADNVRSYQREAITNWKAAGSRGILEMATGTGKTFTAKLAILDFLEEGHGRVVVVTAPTQSIAVQWQATLQELDPIVTFDGPVWGELVSVGGTELSLGIRDYLVVIAIQNTASMDRFHKLIDPLLIAAADSLLVADEVHALGAPYFRRALRSAFRARLGLSATPSRWFDDDGTRFILEYFSGVAFVFGIHEALNWVDPSTGQTALCPYEYEPVFVDLTEEEFLNYEKLTVRIGELLEMGATLDPAEGEKSGLDEELAFLTFKRADILKSAENKVPALSAVLVQLPEIRDCLIYCSDRDQMAEAMEVLNSLGVIYKAFTGEEGTLPQRKFGDLSEREWILQDFVAGRTQALVAMKCLDEGVDIPSATIGIIMASTTNPREFIQRRGRLLRRHVGKERARIFDLVVAPSAPAQGGVRANELVRKIFFREMKRVEEFARDAIDSTRANTKIVAQVMKLGG